MRGTTAYDGACACGGLIEAGEPFWDGEGPMAESKRKFFRTHIVVEVLSEDSPISPRADLDAIHAAITDGDCVGQVSIKHVEALNGPQAARALRRVGSEPGFFRLDERGNDLED